MAELGLAELAPDGPTLLSALDRLTEDGRERPERVTRGHALFRDDPMAWAAGL